MTGKTAGYEWRLGLAKHLLKEEVKDGEPEMMRESRWEDRVYTVPGLKFSLFL